ncbi:OprO/OprP family phosphate-selective porin [Sphingomonas cavernae]|nr:porin [Sphingomonas cavernae]
MKTLTLAALLGATALTAPAKAQTAPSAADIQALKAQIDALQAKVTELEAQMQASKATAAAASAAPAAQAPVKTAEASAPSWKGAPQFEDKAKGFSFKPTGFFQFDTGYVGNPDDAIATTNLGYRTRARRIVLGAQGSLPGGFGYKAEFNFANGEVGYEDVILTWQGKGSPLLVTLGNQFPLSGLDAVTSSKLGTVLERDQATDAFGFARRIGASMGLVDPKDRYTLTAGIFQGPINNSFSDNQWQASIRGTFAPWIGDNGRLHLGANYQHRENATTMTPQARYRARPFTQLTDVRFVDTGTLNVRGDDILGVELAGIFGPFHFASEARKLWTDGYSPSTGNTGAGQVLESAPDFFQGYVEAGFFFTGDTRAYKAGKWDRVKVSNPVDKGGIGAIQLNARLDYLDLSDRFASDLVPAPILINGGQQTGYEMSLIWNPVDYLRFLLQYSHIEVEGGPQAATVVPVSTRPVDQRSYGTDSVALRAQIEF